MQRLTIHRVLTGSVAVGCAALYLDSRHARCHGQHVAYDPKETDIWDRWAQLKAYVGHLWTATPHVPPLPVDKLQCHWNPGGPPRQPVVLVSCGSFNPPTLMHTRMLDLARDKLQKEGLDVLGSYMSPVNDAYWKKDLAPAVHRVDMCQLASASSEHIMVDAWEAEQRVYTRTLYVLKQLDSRLKQLFNGNNNNDGSISTPLVPTAKEQHTTTTSSKSGGKSSNTTNPDKAERLKEVCSTMHVRTVLVCGADVLQSMGDPHVWKQDLLQELLENHGVVCITRSGAGVDAAGVVAQPGTLLNRYKKNVVIVEDPVPNMISSSLVRYELEQGRSVKYLVDDKVLEYIQKHGLYGCAQRHCT